ncbi:hypothetical protein DFO55_12411 [Grimontella sp. AG753]|nr:hypothetical protein DFO55_12411 [Grimontella sp. AG753]
MYEYTDFYDEAEHGGEDGGALLLTRGAVIDLLKQHSLMAPSEWLAFFKDMKLLCVNRYPASLILEWLNY